MSMESHLPLGINYSDFHNVAADNAKALFEAAEKGDLIRMEELVIHKKVPVNVRDKSDGTQAIHLVCADGSGIKPLKFLLEQFEVQKKTMPEKLNNEHSIIDAQDQDGFTPLMTCASNEKYLELEYLLSQGANVNIQNKFGGTVLHTAVSNTSSTSTKIVHAILNHCKNDHRLVNCQRRDGFTALHLAIYNYNPRIAKVLITEAHADCSSKTNSGVTALAIACSRHGMLYDVIHPLLEQGHVSPNSRDDSGETPLHLAAAEGFADVVQYLCDHHNAILYFDKNRKSAFDYAKNNNHIEIAKYIRDYALRQKQAKEEHQQQPQSSGNNSSNNHLSANRSHRGSIASSTSRPMTPNVNFDEHHAEKEFPQNHNCSHCQDYEKEKKEMLSKFAKERQQWNEQVNYLKKKLETQERESQREIQRLNEVCEGANNARKYEVSNLKIEIEKLKQGKH